MKYLDYALIIVTILASVGALALFFFGRTVDDGGIACTMDAKVCPDGSAVGRIGPSCEFAPCPSTGAGEASIPSDTQDQIDAHNDLIVLDAPRAGSIITSPVTITGKARGTWFFEGSFPVTIVNWDGLIIGEGIATAQGEWMTENFVPFTATINFTFDPSTPYNRGAIILKKDNPSGLPENDDALEIPIILK